MVALKELRGKRVVATDGMAGVLNDLFFDTSKWRVRYLAVDTTHLRMAKERLLFPAASASFAEEGTIVVDLGCGQFGRSPGVARLLSGREMARYRVEAADGHGGELHDLLIAPDWSVAGLTLTAGDSLLPDSPAILDAAQVAHLDRALRVLQVKLSRAEILRLPRIR